MYALTDRDFRMPVLAEDREIAVGGDMSANVAQSLSALGIAKALADQRGDDLLVEIDATRDRLHLRIRSYRNRS
jgi:hypothetical protein